MATWEDATHNLLLTQTEKGHGLGKPSTIKLGAGKPNPIKQLRPQMLLHTPQDFTKVVGHASVGYRWEYDSQKKETQMSHGWTDAWVRYFELIAKIDISHIATAEQRGRDQNLLHLRALGEDLNGPPSASRLGYQELIFF